jgi:hypothetical protein
MMRWQQRKCGTALKILEGAAKKELGNRCYELITQPQSLAVFADNCLRNFLAALQELAL